MESLARGGGQIGRFSIKNNISSKHWKFPENHLRQTYLFSRGGGLAYHYIADVLISKYFPHIFQIKYSFAKLNTSFQVILITNMRRQSIITLDTAPQHYIPILYI